MNKYLSEEARSRGRVALNAYRTDPLYDASKYRTGDSLQDVIGVISACIQKGIALKAELVKTAALVLQLQERDILAVLEAMTGDSAVRSCFRSKTLAPGVERYALHRPRRSLFQPSMQEQLQEYLRKRDARLNGETRPAA